MPLNLYLKWPGLTCPSLSGFRCPLTDNNRMSEELMDSLRDTIRRQDETIAQLQEQLQSKDRQIEQLHILLQQAQAALPAPREGRTWWRFWKR